MIFWIIYYAIAFIAMVAALPRLIKYLITLPDEETPLHYFAVFLAALILGLIWPALLVICVIGYSLKWIHKKYLKD